MPDKKRAALVLDFDGTIFDTEAMDMMFRKVAHQYGVREVDYKNAYSEAKKKYGSNDLSNQVHCMVENVRPGFYGNEAFATTILNDLLFHLDTNARQLVFPDAYRLIDMAEPLKRDIDMYILSRGNYFFQMRKITATGLAGKFKDIFIARTDKSQFLRIIAQGYRRLCFCDNTYEEVIRAYEGISPKHRLNQFTEPSIGIPTLVRWIDRSNLGGRVLEIADPWPTELLHADQDVFLHKNIIDFLMTG